MAYDPNLLQTKATIAALRANVAPTPVIYVQGYYAGSDGGEGEFWLNTADTTSADNGGTVIVDAAGHRYYRSVNSSVYSVLWFGAIGDGTTNDHDPVWATLAAIRLIGGGTLYFPTAPKLSSTLYLFDVVFVTFPNVTILADDGVTLQKLWVRTDVTQPTAGGGAYDAEPLIYVVPTVDGTPQTAFVTDGSIYLDNICLQNLNINSDREHWATQGASSGINAGVGSVRLKFAIYAQVNDCTLDSAYRNSLATSDCPGLKINGGNFTRYGEQGWFAAGAQQTRMNSTRIWGSAPDGSGVNKSIYCIDIEPDTSVVDPSISDVVISGVTMGNSRAAFACWPNPADGIAATVLANDVYLVDSVISEIGGNDAPAVTFGGTQANYWSRIGMSGCSITTDTTFASQNAVLLRYIDGFEWSDNSVRHQSLTTTTYAVDAVQMRHMTMTGGSIKADSARGVRMRGSVAAPFYQSTLADLTIDSGQLGSIVFDNSSSQGYFTGLSLSNIQCTGSVGINAHSVAASSQWLSISAVTALRTNDTDVAITVGGGIAGGDVTGCMGKGRLQFEKITVAPTGFLLDNNNFTGQTIWSSFSTADRQAFNARQATYVAGITAPSVNSGTASTMVVTNSGATSITNLSDGIEGQQVTLSFSDGNTTLVNGNSSDGGLLLSGATNWNATTNDTITLVKIAGLFRELCRTAI